MSEYNIFHLLSFSISCTLISNSTNPAIFCNAITILWCKIFPSRLPLFVNCTNLSLICQSKTSTVFYLFMTTHSIPKLLQLLPDEYRWILILDVDIFCYDEYFFLYFFAFLSTNLQVQVSNRPFPAISCSSSSHPLVLSSRHLLDNSFCDSCLPASVVSQVLSHSSFPPLSSSNLTPPPSPPPSAPPEDCSLEGWLTWYGLTHISGFLKAIGVHTVADLAYVREEDLVLLKPVTRRRILACNKRSVVLLFVVCSLVAS